MMLNLLICINIDKIFVLDNVLNNFPNYAKEKNISDPINFFNEFE